MTLAMPDSTNVANLPDGYPAYLGYADGNWPTAAKLESSFPQAQRIILTVTGATLDADGCDVETGDLTPAGGADWCLRKLAAAPKSRPVYYASVSVMPEAIAELGNQLIRRDQVRLVSAHYSPHFGAHICGPLTCAWPAVPPMDGTQWTSTFRGVGGSLIDMSMLGDGFFGPDWTEKLVQELPMLGAGSTGDHVRTVQGLLIARGYHKVAVDGIFGPDTTAGVKMEQLQAHIAQDGIVGPQTWPVLLGIA